MKKQQYSKDILKLLAQKPAIAVPEIVERISPQKPSEIAPYAISRAIKTLQEAGLLEKTFSGQQEYARLTQQGRKKFHSISLESETALVNPIWDGKWRIIMLDIPESRKSEREGLRYLLKKAGFVCIKNSVWVSQQPFEHLFINIKKDLGCTTELMIFVTDTIDADTEAEFLKRIR